MPVLHHLSDDSILSPLASQLKQLVPFQFELLILETLQMGLLISRQNHCWQMWSAKLCANRHYPCVMWVCGHLSVLKLETKQRNTIVKKALNISLSSKGLKEDEYFPAEIIWPRCTIKLLQVSLSKISSKLNNYSLIFTKLLGENFIYISNQWNCVYFFFFSKVTTGKTERTQHQGQKWDFKSLL